MSSSEMLHSLDVIPVYQSRHMYRVPARAQRFYRYLHEEKHFSQMTLLVGLLAIPLTLGKTTVAVHGLHHIIVSIAAM